MFNMLKTAVLMAAITALFMAIGSLLGGQQGMVLALIVALGMNFFSYWFSDKLVLKMYNAQEVDETSAPQFYRMIRELSQRASLPMPRVYIIEEDAPNAFATGRNPEHAAVAARTPGTARICAAPSRVSSAMPARVSNRVAVTDVRMVNTLWASKPASTARKAIEVLISSAAPKTSIKASATSPTTSVAPILERRPPRAPRFMAATRSTRDA